MPDTPSPFTARPEPPESSDGFHFEAVEAGPSWATPSVGAGRCRAGAGAGVGACGAPTVATLFRNTFHRGTWELRPWDYCAEHLYGRWIEDGKVMGWRLVKDENDD